jgi:hypothetical protein
LLGCGVLSTIGGSSDSQERVLSGRDVDGGCFDGIGDGFNGCSSNAGSCFFERFGGSFDGALVCGCCGAFVYCGGDAKLIALITLRYRDNLISAAGRKAVGERRRCQ